jgi:predicted TIM-barrel fold metal-dependent hydrolase
MVATAPNRQETSGRPTRPALIDCDHHNELDSDADLYPYLSSRWLEHVKTYGLRGAAGGFYPRFMPHREDARPPSGRKSGTDARFTVRHFMDPENVAHAILIPLNPSNGQLNLDLSAALATAVNEWQVAEWLDVDPRFRASIAVSTEDPARAVEEIERRAADKRFVQVQFSGRPHEPMGRRKYWPIYEACVEHGLQVMSHAFGSYGQPITGTGWPSFYVDDHVGPSQAMQANITSMVVEGVFEEFPTLNLVSAENGFGWLPSLCWRLDSTWHLLKAEVPHLKRLPSEYVREHVYVCTQPMEEPHRPRQFTQLLEHFGPMVDRIVFATDYPHWDADDPDEAFPVAIPPELQQKIYFDNAAGLYGLK